METQKHDLPNLFLQLGLPAEPADISRFVEGHRPLANDVNLADAGFWSAAQSQFLRDEILEDADWAEVIDQLSLMLRD